MRKTFQVLLFSFIFLIFGFFLTNPLLASSFSGGFSDSYGSEICPFSNSVGRYDNTNNVTEKVQCYLKPNECSGQQRESLGTTYNNEETARDD